MVELITVMVLVGVLAAVALPRLDGVLALRSAGWRDQLLAGLLQARTLAQGHRRLVCVTLAIGELRLSQASNNPASNCNSVLAGADGDARWASDGNAITLTQSRWQLVLPARWLHHPSLPGTGRRVAARH